MLIVYLVLSAVWIVLSDYGLRLLIDDVDSLTRGQTFKGWVFITLTGLLLYLLLRWQERKTLSLKNQVERFAQTFGHVPLGVAYLNISGEWVEVNDSLCRMLGCGRGELRQLDFVTMCTVGNTAVDSTDMRRLFWGDVDTLSVETDFRRADGARLPLRVTGTLVRNARGEPSYVVAFFENLSRQRHIEQRLRDHLENSPLAVLELDRNLCVSYWSPQAEIMFGWSAAEVLGRPWITWRFIHDEDRQWVEDATAELLSRRSSRSVIRNRNYTRSGEVRDCIWYNSILIDEQGDVLSILSQGNDITEREQAYRELRDAKKLLEKIFVSLREAVFVIDPKDRRIVACNDAVTEILGYRPEELIGRDTEMLHVDHEHFERFSRDYDAKLAETGTVQMEYQLRRRDGTIIDTENTITMIDAGEALEATQVVSVVRDISARKQAAEQQRLAAMVFDNANEAIVIADAERSIVYTNPAFHKMTGYAAEEVKGQGPTMLDPGIHDDTFYNTMWETVDHDGHWQGEVASRRRNGQTYPTWLSISAVRNAAGAVMNYILIATDLSEQRRLDERVRYLSFHDSVTGLLNRPAMVERLEQAIIHCQRAKRDVAVLILNIDRFKMVNDSLGHAVGDLLLKQVARDLRGAVRAGDSVARLAADQFVVVLSELARPDDVGPVLEKITASVGNLQSIDGQEVYVGFSIGVALYPRDGDRSEVLVRNADVAMNQARAEGGGRYRFFTRQMHDRAVDLLAMEGELRRAVERGELKVCYQPQISVVNERIVGAEALLRWQSKRYGAVSPARFIPVAEASGLILPIGRWIFEQVVRQTRIWRDEGLLSGSVAVNLSARQFREAQLAQTIRESLDREGLPAEALELELTESLVMEDAVQAAKILAELKAMGLRLSMDDFGTGYSSLSHLKRFPFDTLKIDQSFVRDITVDSDDAAIADSIIAMAHAMGMRVIAEGVEDAEQLAHLRRRGCDFAQGFYCSPAVDPETFQALLRGDWRLQDQASRLEHSPGP
ncbi:hypothetical protein Tel_07055 [Candidatus Tenderia electrophaga]|uniref:cyclic-guanylate-specific phosphodiesterase n=1 Tax=Candidatus Tenderia electrophaga TaxID=1748243 RepID=A0A0S2TCP6_9GAMM|nr:hypothetical protein Tel_07055 [Candidatus Tenderia electrophaga]